MTDEEKAYKCVRRYDGIYLAFYDKLKAIYLDGLAEGRKENKELFNSVVELTNIKTELENKVTELESKYNELNSWHDSELIKTLEKLQDAEREIKELKGVIEVLRRKLEG